MLIGVEHGYGYVLQVDNDVVARIELGRTKEFKPLEADFFYVGPEIARRTV